MSPLKKLCDKDRGRGPGATCAKAHRAGGPTTGPRPRRRHHDSGFYSLVARTTIAGESPGRSHHAERPRGSCVAVRCSRYRFRGRSSKRDRKATVAVGLIEMIRSMICERLSGPMCWPLEVTVSNRPATGQEPSVRILCFLTRPPPGNHVSDSGADRAERVTAMDLRPWSAAQK